MTNCNYLYQQKNIETINMLNDLGKQLKSDSFLIDYILFRYNDVEEIKSLFNTIINKKLH